MQSLLAVKRVDEFTEDDKAAIAELAFERYFRHGGIFGAPAKCRDRLEGLRASGIDEVGCLVDFGVSAPAILASLERIGEMIAADAGPTVDLPDAGE
jgi:alkanesulfonate monooxygenase SsuD/methylene tetrahydromethanopterin reductase-like flavin-dependent oxidoreductase (luciferase family)